jgi:hypothetical protein
VTGNVEELEDLLSSPTPADCDAIARLEGDLMVLGVAGKMGPSLAVRARRAADRAGVRKRIAGVARFTDPAVRAGLERCGVETIAADLLDRNAVRALPDAPNIIYLAGRKFGTRGREDLTWAMNVLAPDVVAERYGNSRIVALSSGNVYPFRRVAEGGATEEISGSLDINVSAVSAMGGNLRSNATTVISHELGHVVGLDHVYPVNNLSSCSNVQTIMYESFSSLVRCNKTIANTTCDGPGVRTVYGNGPTCNAFNPGVCQEGDSCTN